MREESSYIEKIRDESLEPGWRYVHDLELLRAVIGQSERTRSYGSNGSWVNERYLGLKEKHPDTLMGFEAEPRIE